MFNHLTQLSDAFVDVHRACTVMDNLRLIIVMLVIRRERLPREACQPP